jgi:hypothetical protein
MSLSSLVPLLTFIAPICFCTSLNAASTFSPGVCSATSSIVHAVVLVALGQHRCLDRHRVVAITVGQRRLHHVQIIRFTFGRIEGQLERLRERAGRSGLARQRRGARRRTGRHVDQIDHQMAVGDNCPPAQRIVPLTSFATLAAAAAAVAVAAVGSRHQRCLLRRRTKNELQPAKASTAPTSATKPSCAWENLIQRENKHETVRRLCAIGFFAGEAPSIAQKYGARKVKPAGLSMRRRMQLPCISHCIPRHATLKPCACTAKKPQLRRRARCAMSRRQKGAIVVDFSTAA